MKYHPKFSRWVVRHLLSSLSACSNKVDGEALTEQLVSLFQLFLERGDIPRDLKEANIVHLYKNKVKRSPVTTTEASHSSAMLASYCTASS